MSACDGKEERVRSFFASPVFEEAFGMRAVRALLLAVLTFLMGSVLSEAAEERWPVFNLADPAGEKVMDLYTRSFHNHFAATVGESMLLYASRKIPIEDVVRQCRDAFADRKIDYNGTVYATFTDISRENMENMLQNGNILYFFPAFLAVNQHRGDALISEGLLSEKAVTVLAAMLPLLSDLVRNGELQSGMAAELRDQRKADPDGGPAPRPAPRGATGS